MQKLVEAARTINYWAIVLLPFSVAISPGFANVVIAVLIIAFLSEKMIKTEKPFLPSLPLAIFCLFIIAGALSFVNTVSVPDSVRGMIKLLKAMLIFGVCSQSIRDKEHLKKIVVSVVFSISLIGFDALWQSFSGRDFIRGNLLQSAIGLPRATASFPGCNGLGVYLTALTPLIAGLALFSSRLRNRVFFLIAALLGCLGIGLTLSRGAGFGLLAGLLIVSFAKRSYIVISAMVLLIGASLFFMPDNIKKWAKGEHYNPLVMMTCQTRIGIYRNTAYMIGQHPFLGVGINTFSRNYGKYRQEAVEATNPTADNYYAHNNFLHIAGEMGLVGLAIFLAFLFSVLKSVWASFRKHSDPFLKACSISVLAAICAYLVNGLTETSLYYSRIVMIFWFLIGLGLALGRIGDDSSKQQA